MKSSTRVPSGTVIHEIITGFDLVFKPRMVELHSNKVSTVKDVDSLVLAWNRTLMVRNPFWNMSLDEMNSVDKNDKRLELKERFDNAVNIFSKRIICTPQIGYEIFIACQRSGYGTKNGVSLASWLLGYLAETYSKYGEKGYFFRENILTPQEKEIKELKDEVASFNSAMYFITCRISSCLANENYIGESEKVKTFGEDLRIVYKEANYFVDKLNRKNI